MGKVIDLTQPLSDEDRAWLLERGALGDLRVADELARVAAEADSPVEEPVSEPEEADEDVEGSEVYGTWTKAQLQYELGARNLPQYGVKAELVARLEEADSGIEPVDADDEPSDGDEQ